MMAWLTGEGLTPHGFCLTWNPALLFTHVVSDAVMGISYIGCGAIIFWFGRRRPDMAPPILFWSLAVVFALCGITHLTDIGTMWVAAYPLQGAMKAVTAVASGVTITVLAFLAPRTLAIPSMRQVEQLRDTLTEEKARHSHTAARLARLVRAVEQNPNMFIVTDRSGTIEYVNRAFEVLTGYDKGSAVGCKPSILASENTPRWVHDNLWASVCDQREWRGELMDRRKDGSEFWVATSIAPLRNDEGDIDGFVAVHQDITDRKLAEEEMLVAKRQAEIANKAKSELLANMSHELRTPLNAIIGFADAMQSRIFGPISPPRYEEYVSDICNSGRHLLDLINDVLDVSAIEAGKLTLFEERVPLAEILRQSVGMMRERAKAQNVTLVLEGHEPLEVVIDQRRLKQVVINLLSNAVKFTQPGGSVAITAYLSADRTLSISVADTGIGMTGEEIDLALQLFGQVDGSLQRRHEGTGLGLPICIGIMERHGGTLRLHSVKGEGTTVIVTLPSVRVFEPAQGRAVNA